MFANKIEAKSERVAKNELQRLRNIAKSKGVKVPRMGIPTADKLNSNQLLMANTVAKASTASLGKFQQKLPKEKEVRSKGVAEITPGVGKKRKAKHLDIKAEKERNMSTITALLNKRPAIDIEKAVNKQMYEDQVEYVLLVVFINLTSKIKHKKVFKNYDLFSDERRLKKIENRRRKVVNEEIKKEKELQNQQREKVLEIQTKELLAGNVAEAIYFLFLIILIVHKMEKISIRLRRFQ